MACVFRRCRGDGIRAPLPLMGKSITLGESILSFHLPRTSRSGSRSTTQEIQSLSRTLGLAGNGQTFRGALPEERCIGPTWESQSSLARPALPRGVM